MRRNSILHQNPLCLSLIPLPFPHPSAFPFAFPSAFPSPLIFPRKHTPHQIPELDFF